MIFKGWFIYLLRGSEAPKLGRVLEGVSPGPDGPDGAPSPLRPDGPESLL